MRFFAGALLALAAFPNALGINAPPPNGQVRLGIARDVADTGGIQGAAAGVTYTSKITFEDDVMTGVLDGASQADKDAQLAGLAQNAYWEMKESPDFPGGSRTAMRERRPYVMTALAVGKTIYFASSMRMSGGNFIYAGKDKNNPLYQGLVQCQIAFREAKKYEVSEEQSRHMNKAACGEAMAMYAYFQDERAAGREGNLQGAVVVSVRVLNSRTQEILPWEEINVIKPCASDMVDVTEPDKLKYFGCTQMTAQMNVRAITAEVFQPVKLPDRRQQSPVHLDCSPLEGYAEPAN